MKVNTKANVMCPQCGSVQEVEMPVDACEIFYQCGNCGVFLMPKENDCCIFCSYADVPCPSKQKLIKQLRNQRRGKFRRKEVML